MTVFPAPKAKAYSFTVFTELPPPKIIPRDNDPKELSAPAKNFGRGDCDMYIMSDMFSEETEASPDTWRLPSSCTVLGSFVMYTSDWYVIEPFATRAHEKITHEKIKISLTIQLPFIYLIITFPDALKIMFFPEAFKFSDLNRDPFS